MQKDKTLQEINFRYQDGEDKFICITCGKVYKMLGNHLDNHYKTHNMIIKAKKTYIKEENIKNGKLLWKKRHELGESLAQFGNRFDVHRSSVSNWENGYFRLPKKVLAFVLSDEVVPEPPPMISYPKLPDLRRFLWEKHFYEFTLKPRRDLLEGSNMWKANSQTGKIVTPNEIFDFIKSIIRIEREDILKDIEAIEIEVPQTIDEISYNEGIKQAIKILRKRLKSQTEETQ